MRGAYGLRLAGLGDIPELVLDAPESWTAWSVVRKVGAARGELSITQTAARVPLQSEGMLEIDRVGATMTFTTATPLGAPAMAHPYLAPAAAVVAAWLGHSPFHAGAFVQGDGAWVVLADSGSGKSTLLAYAASQGRPVLADDLVVIRDRTAMAGPRCVDLRADGARALGAGRPLGVIGARDRWRVATGITPAETPVHGFVALDWGRVSAVERPDAAERMSLLHRHLALVQGRPDIEAILDLAALPLARLVRPRDLSGLAESAVRLFDELDAVRG